MKEENLISEEIGLKNKIDTIYELLQKNEELLKFYIRQNDEYRKKREIDYLKWEGTGREFDKNISLIIDTNNKINIEIEGQSDVRYPNGKKKTTSNQTYLSDINNETIINAILEKIKSIIDTNKQSFKMKKENMKKIAEILK